MRRIYLTAMAFAALALALPGVASARHSSRHDARKAASHHRHHRHHSRKITFAAKAKTTTTTSPSAPTKTTTEPMPGSGEVAGTVTSFEGGILKITLADNSVVSGKVTEQTEISCSTPQPEGEDGDDSGEVQDTDDNEDNQDNQDSHGGGSFSHDGGGGGFSGSNGDDMRGASTPTAAGPTCGTAALVPGAKVHEAELSISGAGAVWDKVDLIQ
jgi:hypothetical protein